VIAEWAEGKEQRAERDGPCGETGSERSVVCGQSCGQPSVIQTGKELNAKSIAHLLGGIKLNQDIVAERIRKFLVQQFPATKKVGNDESLLKNGFIDSLGILEVVAFLENEFRIAVSDDDLLPENFGSVQSITDFVQAKASSV
jgi:acyl carrier protein